MTQRVQFQCNYPPYASGEIAGLPDDQATRLQAAGTVTILGPSPAVPSGAIADRADDVMLRLGSQPFFNAPLQKTPGT